MEHNRQEPWFIRLGAARIFVLCAVLALVLMAAGYVMGARFSLLLAVLGPVCSGVLGVVGAIVWVCRNPIPADVLRLPYPVPVSLADFLSQPEAVIAPNLSDQESESLANWLLSFCSRHGEDSVWILPHDDGPSADRVLFLVNEFTSADEACLGQLHVDGIAGLSAAMREKLLPHISDQRRLYEALWD